MSCYSNICPRSEHFHAVSSKQSRRLRRWSINRSGMNKLRMLEILELTDSLCWLCYALLSLICLTEVSPLSPYMLQPIITWLVFIWSWRSAMESELWTGLCISQAMQEFITKYWQGRSRTWQHPSCQTGQPGSELVTYHSCPHRNIKHGYYSWPPWYRRHILHDLLWSYDLSIMIS